jgi:hypothetical protein
MECISADTYLISSATRFCLYKWTSLYLHCEKIRCRQGCPNTMRGLDYAHCPYKIQGFLGYQLAGVRSLLALLIGLDQRCPARLIRSERQSFRDALELSRFPVMRQARLADELLTVPISRASPDGDVSGVLKRGRYSLSL